ncbi:hypothetical protein GDO86_000491 [Hymenochirus boettgeri]|uniref:Protein inturned n=1 Tax=Hymenochirus boettgeri TaxID=247094 RepID=A0A8T2KHN5_9PIPI|nr:hypothetical protein GDO86_000491 [Hymenochirus boettgeri]
MDLTGGKSLPEREGSEDQSGGSRSSSYTDCSSCCSSDLEPEWLEKVQKNGELFYVELSEKEEEIIFPHCSLEPGSVNNLQFHQNKLSEGTRSARKRNDPPFKRLTKMLKRHTGKKATFGTNGTTQPLSILQQHSSQVVNYQYRDTCLYMNPGHFNENRTSNFLQDLVGIVHQSSSINNSTEKEETFGTTHKKSSSENIVVHGFIPKSPAVRCGQIFIGDTLVAVNDVEVHTENIERVLSCIPGPMQVKLTFKTPVFDAFPSQDACKQTQMTMDNLATLIWGEDYASPLQVIQNMPYIVMYLTLRLDSDASKDEQEILYQYPVSEASHKLKSIRGLFLTLSDMLQNVTGSQIVSSSLVLNEQLVHVSYWKENDKLFLIVVPAERFPLLRLKNTIADLVRSLKFMYNTLDRAFCERQNICQLDHFFNLYFQRVLRSVSLNTNTGHTINDTCSYLMMEIDTVLSDLEALDFAELSEDYYEMRRLYVITGTCLFYKGYLLSNHLPKEDLVDIVLYCRQYCLLALSSERISQLVIWREVYPNFHFQQGLSPATEEYSAPEGRYFLLIVGLKHFMLCTLLEAGGCTSKAIGNPGPDYIYVDQVKTTLLQLEILDVNIEERINLGPNPCLSCADWFLPSAKDKLGTNTNNAVLSKLQTPQKKALKKYKCWLYNKLTPDTIRIFGRHDFKVSGSIDGSGGTLFKLSKKYSLPNPFNLGNLRRSLTERESEELYNSVKLTSGHENTLFHYLYFETVQGVFISPTHKEVEQLGGSMHSQLVKNFHYCCLSIRSEFQHALKEEKSKWSESGACVGVKGLCPVKEHGILFECSPENWDDQKKLPPTMSYWVIGRLFMHPNPQEFYVCFHDSVTEIAVELAFKLSFGIPL